MTQKNHQDCCAKDDMRQMTEKGRQIESDSFRIIDEEVGAHGFSPPQWEVVRRIIHATADFEFKQITRFSPRAVEAGVKALREGCAIIVDVKMITAGLNQKRLDTYGCRVYSFISDQDVIQEAKRENLTRSIVAMRKAGRLGLAEGSIIAIGNAPTALMEVIRMIRQDEIHPALIIGVPVGFVSAAESKEAAALLKVPSITTRGRKGGTTIAVAVLHALLSLSKEMGA